MRTIKYLFTLSFALLLLPLMAQNSLTGKISDSASGNTLPGVVIYIPDLKVAAQSDADGNYTLDNIPKGTFVVEIRLLGYQIISEALK